jgi:DNA-binding GntR family transcriptional regulator
MSELQSQTTISHYYTVAETLRRRIETMEYSHGALIPSEKELAKEFSVSTITIRKALELLVKDGLIYRKRGVGTRVIHQHKERLPIKITGSFRDLFGWSSYYDQETKVIDVSLRECPPLIRDILRLPPGEKIVRIRRIRKFKRNTVSYYINYAPQNFLGNLKKKDLENKSFIKVFQETSGIKVIRAEQQTEAITADMDLSSILGNSFGDPLLFVENIYFSKDEIPVEVSHMYFRSDFFVIRSSIHL